MIRELARTEWPSFLQSFSLQHDGWLVSVESAHGKKSELKASDRPLEGVTAEDPPREITIAVGDSSERRRFVLRHPRRLFVESENGVETSISIEENDGTLTRVRFRSAIAPELVDGVPPLA